MTYLAISGPLGAVADNKREAENLLTARMRAYGLSRQPMRTIEIAPRDPFNFIEVIHVDRPSHTRPAYS